MCVFQVKTYTVPTAGNTYYRITTMAQEFSTWNGVQPVSRDFQPVWGENPFVKFLISLKSTEILYPTLVKFS